MDWNTLSYVERAEIYYEDVASQAEISINQEDIVLAQEIKVKIAKLLLACLSCERTKPMIRVIGKYVRLDNKLCKFILMKLRAEFVNLNPEGD